MSASGPAVREGMSSMTRVSRRLPARYGTVLMPLLISIIMTFIVSGISTLKALGPTIEALRSWPAAWGISWLVAFPTLMLVLPVVRRILARVLAPH
jgi:hypothetical protein